MTFNPFIVKQDPFQDICYTFGSHFNLGRRLPHPPKPEKYNA